MLFLIEFKGICAPIMFNNYSKTIPKNITTAKIITL